MRIAMILMTLAMSTVACTAAPAAEPEFDGTALPDTVADWDGFRGSIHREGRVYIAGQPAHYALLQLPARQVICVVNLRTPSEMEDRERVPFDEAALVDSLGVRYVSIPLGGREYPYTPAAVDSFAVILDDHEGPVLLHCTVAWRASHLWAAYLVRHRNLSVPDAYRRGEHMGIGVTPFARLLDQELLFVPALPDTD